MARAGQSFGELPRADQLVHDAQCMQPDGCEMAPRELSSAVELNWKILGWIVPNLDLQVCQYLIIWFCRCQLSMMWGARTSLYRFTYLFFIKRRHGSNTKKRWVCFCGIFMQYFCTFSIQWSHELEQNIERCKHYSSAKHTYSELDYNLNHYNKFRVKLRIHHQPDNTPTYMSNFSIQKWNPKKPWIFHFLSPDADHLTIFNPTIPSKSLTLSPKKILLPCSAYHEFPQDPTYQMRQNQNGKLGGPGGKKSLVWMIPCRKICRK